MKSTAEALRLRVWTATRLGFRPCDRRGTILRCWQDKVEVKWDLPIGSLNRITQAQRRHGAVKMTGTWRKKRKCQTA